MKTKHLTPLTPSLALFSHSLHAQALLACEGLEQSLFESCMSEIARDTDGGLLQDEALHAHHSAVSEPHAGSKQRLGSSVVASVGEWQCLSGGVCPFLHLFSVPLPLCLPLMNSFTFPL